MGVLRSVSVDERGDRASGAPAGIQHATRCDRGGRADTAWNVAIGVVVYLDIVVGGPVTGASMNAACSRGSAVMSGQVATLWI